MQVAVLADTHLRGGIEPLPAVLREELERADAIVHAGDVTSAAALDDLRRLGPPLHAVLGNNDVALAGDLPDQLEIELAGVRVAVVHDSGAATGRAARMARRFPRAQLVIFGHSHVPLDDAGDGGQLLFNPGSPTQRRRQPYPTFGRLRLEHGRVVGREILQLPRPRG